MTPAAVCKVILNVCAARGIHAAEDREVVERGVFAWLASKPNAPRSYVRRCVALFVEDLAEGQIRTRE